MISNTCPHYLTKHNTKKLCLFGFPLRSNFLQRILHLWMRDSGCVQCLLSVVSVLCFGDWFWFFFPQQVRPSTYLHIYTWCIFHSKPLAKGFVAILIKMWAVIEKRKLSQYNWNWFCFFSAVSCVNYLRIWCCQRRCWHPSLGSKYHIKWIHLKIPAWCDALCGQTIVYVCAFEFGTGFLISQLSCKERDSFKICLQGFGQSCPKPGVSAVDLFVQSASLHHCPALSPHLTKVSESLEQKQSPTTSQHMRPLHLKVDFSYLSPV